MCRKWRMHRFEPANSFFFFLVYIYYTNMWLHGLAKSFYFIMWFTVATIWGQSLIKGSIIKLSSEIFCKNEGFEKSQLSDTWCCDMGLKQNFISCCFATKQYIHGTSNPFPCTLLPVTSLVTCPPCLKKWTLTRQFSGYMTNNLLSTLHADSKTVRVISWSLTRLLTCYSNCSCSY